jgi:hypothetical protein
MHLSIWHHQKEHVQPMSCASLCPIHVELALQQEKQELITHGKKNILELIKNYLKVYHVFRNLLVGTLIL